MTSTEQRDVLVNVFSDLGNKLSTLSLDQINVLEKFVLEIYAVGKVDSLTQARLDKFMMSTSSRSINSSQRASMLSSWLFMERVDR